MTRVELRQTIVRLLLEGDHKTAQKIAEALGEDFQGCLRHVEEIKQWKGARDVERI